jgi:tRNA A22 N-methylase
MQKSMHKNSFFFIFLRKNSQKFAFWWEFGERFGEQNGVKNLILYGEGEEWEISRYKKTNNFIIDNSNILIFLRIYAIIKCQIKKGGRQWQSHTV